MATWKKYFKPYDSTRMPTDKSHSGGDATNRRYSSWLPEVYQGQPQRIQRYGQYDQMDLDSEVNAALDVIAEFSTLKSETTSLPFVIQWEDSPSEAESEVVQKSLRQWVAINEFKKRAFRIFRNTVKYGDQIFIRDPETYKLYWVDPANVEKIIVNEGKGKIPEVYFIKDVDLNLESMSITAPVEKLTPQNAGFVNNRPTTNTISPAAVSARQLNDQQAMAVDAKHIIHISLGEGIDGLWPFGASILEPVFKVFKQKELLEDAILIYRVQRAPERRVFYIDVGGMPTHKARAHLERIKNEIHQRRIPSKTGGGQNITDSAYNPLCLSLDTTVPLLDGRTLTLNQLIEEYQQGKENWTYSCDPLTGEILPGNITWAGVTRKDTQVIKLHLNDGSTVTLTPDHKVPVLGKGFVEAQHLTENDSLISYQTKKVGLSSSSSDRTYTQIYDHKKNDWVYVHRMVGEFFRAINKHQEFTYLPENIGAHKTIIHHDDFDRYNNDPRNLKWMNENDHNKYCLEQNMCALHSTEEEIHSKNHEFNNRVAKIEWLSETQDTGTITIDSNERWHNHHTFPVNGSIFVKNSIMEDYFFAQTSEGRGSKVETLPGGENLGQIDDLRFFNNKMFRGLRVPPSYMGVSDADSASSYSDGRVGNAMIQEFRFTKFCERLQSLIVESFDREFKMFLKHRGIQVESSMFNVAFNPPQHFGKYRQAEVDSVMMQVFSSIADADYISKRFAMKRFLGLSEDEILENERLWKEEHPDDSASTGDQDGLKSVGAAPPPDMMGGEMDDFDFDDELDDGADGLDSPISGAENSPIDDTSPMDDKP